MIKPLLKASYPVKGQILSEYGLAIGLVGVAAIGGLLYYQDQVAAIWSGYKFGNGTTVAAASIPSNTASTTAQGANGGASSNGVAPTASIRLSDGTIINLGNYPTNLGKTVETTGVNGTTDILASTIEQFAKSLADQGKITPNQSSLLKDLANKAHGIAATQKFIENMIKTPGMTAQTLSETPLTYNSGTYDNVWSVALGRVGMCDPGVVANCGASSSEYGGQAGTSSLILSGDGKYWGEDTAAFLQVYESVKASGMMTDPTISSFVGQLVGNVTTLADTFESNVLTTTNPGYTTDNSQITDFDKNVASQLTDINGVAICTTGSGTDSGVHCQ